MPSQSNSNPSKGLNIQDVAGGLTLEPGNILVGSTTAGDVTITDDNTTNAAVYPVWALGAGDQPEFISTIQLSFNPFLGVMTAAGFAGDFQGTTTTQAPLDNSTKLSSTAYADAAVAAGVVGGFRFKGVIDASGDPNYPAALVGDTYKISVAGKIGGVAGVPVAVGDTVYCSVNNAGGDQAAVGADFVILEGETQGEVIGPSSAVNTDIAIFDGTSGQLIADSGLAVTGSTIAASVTGNAGTVTDGVYTTDTGTVTGTMIVSSVALAGNPTTTTQSPGDNTTKIATTAFVTAANALDVLSDVSGTTGGVAITNIMSISAAAYALITPDATTLYFIT